jgi:hypothetical protein
MTNIEVICRENLGVDDVLLGAMDLLSKEEDTEGNFGLGFNMEYFSLACSSTINGLYDFSTFRSSCVWSSYKKADRILQRLLTKYEQSRQLAVLCIAVAVMCCNPYASDRASPGRARHSTSAAHDIAQQERRLCAGG